MAWEGYTPPCPPHSCIWEGEGRLGHTTWTSKVMQREHHAQCLGRYLTFAVLIKASCSEPKSPPPTSSHVPHVAPSSLFLLRFSFSLCFVVHISCVSVSFYCRHLHFIDVNVLIPRLHCLIKCRVSGTMTPLLDLLALLLMVLPPSWLPSLEGCWRVSIGSLMGLEGIANHDCCMSPLT